MKTLSLLCVVFCTLMACPTVWSLSGCDPLDPYRCNLPFPNDFWLRNNSQHQPRLALTPEFVPKDSFGIPFDPEAGGWNTLDGFSAAMPLTTYFKDVSLDMSRLPTYWNMTASLAPNVGSILLDTTTGKAVPHFVELDERGGPEGDHLLMLWPATRLESGRTYIVAFRNLVDNRAQGIAPSAAFQALRDGTSSSDPDVNERRDLFRWVFSHLESAGFSKTSLNIAWSFTTMSQNAFSGETGKPIFIRDDGLKRIQNDGIKYVINSVKPGTNLLIAKEIEASVFVPQYVDQQFPGARLVLNKEGQPVFQKYAPANFTILIPQSVFNGTVKPEDTRILQYGHGLFGSRKEVHSGYLAVQANKYGYILAASDWIGLSNMDVIPVALMMLDNLTAFGMIPDRCSQGMLRALTVMRLFSDSGFLKDPAMLGASNAPVALPTANKHYYGNSQGGILGSVYMGMTQDVFRGTVGVPGGPYSILLPRSKDFEAFYLILRVRWPDELDMISLLGLFQLLWDRMDPGAFMNSITSNPLPNTPAHDLMVVHALGDCQVTYLGAYHLARSAGASRFTSTAHEPGEQLYGFPVVSDSQPIKHAGIVSWYFDGVPPVPRVDIPPTSVKTDTHECPRRQPETMAMMDEFFRTGQYHNHCNGICTRSYTECHYINDPEPTSEPTWTEEQGRMDKAEWQMRVRGMAAQLREKLRVHQESA